MTAAPHTVAHRWYGRLICDHVAHHKGGYRQGSEAWLQAKSNVVGGSELATLMGLNPYSTWEELVAKKLGFAVGNPPGVACWWGTFFEPVSERLVELDCATKLHGCDIHVRNPGLIYHGNSPDGYCVISLEESDDGWVLSHDPAKAVREGRHVQAYPVLVELKAPYRRLPNGKPPRYYLPQVWSGIALSPPTHAGFFVEIVFRVCSLPELGSSAEYSKKYHSGDLRSKNPPSWSGAFSWGVTAIYAPLHGTRSLRMSDRTDHGDKAKVGTAVIDAFRILCSQVGYIVKPGELGTHVADLGQLACDSPRDFDKVFEHLNRKELKYRHSDPVKVGPSSSQEAGDGLGAFMDRAETAPATDPDLGPHYYLFGFLPWKVFQVDYHLVPPRDAFLGEIDKITTEFMGDVNRLRAAREPRLAYREYCLERQKRKLASKKGGPSKSDSPFSASSRGASEEEKRSLFSWASSRLKAPVDRPA